MPKSIVLCIFLLLSLLCRPQAAAAETLEGRVLSVHDGDTITLLSFRGETVKIRLAQIDAPEIDQPYGQQSRQSLAGMVNHRYVRVEVETLDKYGRTVGTVYADGRDTSREQIRRGMAWAYRQYLHDSSLLQVEDTARLARIGLWADAQPTQPWAHRHACGNKRHCKEMANCQEAKYYLSQCGLTGLDRDRDGIPCESLCGK